MYLIMCAIKAGACRLFCHGFTHVDSHIEELQFKGDLSPSQPSPFPSTSGLEQGAPFAVSSVSDLVKLDILNPPPQQKGVSLSLPGTQPLSVARAFSYIIHNTHRDRCPQC